MSVEIDFKQATELFKMYGNEACSLTLIEGDKSYHSGEGLYVFSTDYPEEGLVFLGKTDEEAIPQKAKRKS